MIVLVAFAFLVGGAIGFTGTKAVEASHDKAENGYIVVDQNAAK